MIVLDDWGWASFGLHRQAQTPEVQTPHLDDLARQGVLLDRMVAYKFCGPSRSALLSGRLPYHVSERNDPPSLHNASDPIAGWAGVPPDMTMWPKKLQEVGYQTHFVGKADWGAASARQFPAQRGFGTGFGYMHHCVDYVNQAAPSWKNDTATSSFRNCGDAALDSPACGLQQVNSSGGTYRYFTDLWQHEEGESIGGPAYGINGTGFVSNIFSARVEAIVRRHDSSGGPLALYYALHLPHSPIEITDEWYNRFSFVDDPLRRRYDAMVAMADDAVGNVTRALRQAGLWENTLIIAASDNGGPIYAGGGANNWPLRGSKYSDWNGGILVNAFASGGLIPEAQRGTARHGLVHLADVYATFCELAGADPSDRPAERLGLPGVDSVSAWGYIAGTNTTAPRDGVVVSSQTLIHGRWKLITGQQRASTWTGPQYPNASSPNGGTGISNSAFNLDCDAPPFCLFDIEDDVTEHRNLAEAEPAVLADMRARLAAAQADAFDPARGEADPMACNVSSSRWGGFYGPFLDLDA